MPFLIDDALMIGSAVAGIGGGILGAFGANDQNNAAQDAYEKQLKISERVAKRTNKYNTKVHRADKANFNLQRDYQNALNRQVWEDNEAIKDFQFEQDLRLYAKSVGLYNQQLGFNEIAAKQAFNNESAALAGLFTKQAFAREDQILGLQKALTEVALNRRATGLEMQSVINKGIIGSTSIQANLSEFTKQTDFKKQNALVENLQAQGQNELRQASTRKGTQATMADFYRGMSELSSALSGKQRQAALQLAELGVETSILEKKLEVQMESLDNSAMSAISDAQFNMRVLDADIASAVAQSSRNMEQISLQKYGADLNAAANLMIEPRRAPTSAAPLPLPDRVWVKPMKVDPAYVTPPVQQNPFAPLISSVSKSLGAAASFDWNF